MILLQQNENLADYLEETYFVNYSTASLQQKVAQLFAPSITDIDKINDAYKFVRDSIHHSADINSHRITKTATEVLHYGEGMCYSKTILFTALLRSQGIHTGFCYQRLTRDDQGNMGYDIHALNAVYIADKKAWVRIDPRGNTNGRNAQFYPDDPLREQLAYTVRTDIGEIDYPGVYTRHPVLVLYPLLHCKDCQEMMAAYLPNSLED